VWLGLGKVLYKYCIAYVLSLLWIAVQVQAQVQKANSITSLVH